MGKPALKTNTQICPYMALLLELPFLPRPHRLCFLTLLLFPANIYAHIWRWRLNSLVCPNPHRARFLQFLSFPVLACPYMKLCGTEALIHSRTHRHFPCTLRGKHAAASKRFHNLCRRNKRKDIPCVQHSSRYAHPR